jgi:hypothetical protein
LPSFFLPRPWYVLIETIVRLVVGATGILLVLGRSHVTRWVTYAPAAALSIGVAAALAVGAGEVALRTIRLQPTEWFMPNEEPRRQIDTELGWVLEPGRTGRASIGGREVEYAVDGHGYRVRSVDQPVDLERPAVVFAGESVMFGEGLTWEESIPTQAGRMLGVPAANIAVHGYSSDQIYMRIARELPRFRQPVALVSIFMTELFGRNLDDDRPHLAPGLAWQPAKRTARLKTLARILVPFRPANTVERGIGVTREVLHATVTLAAGLHVPTLVVVPQFGPEDDAQRALRERVLTADIPNIIVPLDPDWRLSWDRHPNARASRVIATAIAARLAHR